MKRRVVILAANAATVVQFAGPCVTAMQTLGSEIHVVCNLREANLSQTALDAFNQTYPKLEWHDIALSESIGAMRQNARAYDAISSLLQALSPDLLQCHGTIAGWLGRRAAASLSIPVCYIAHDFRVFHGCLLTERLLFSRIERKYAKQTDLFCAVCPEDAAYAEKHLHPKQVVSLADMGINLERYNVSAQMRETVRASLGIPDEAIVLISVGTLRMQKRLRVILQAMARLRDRHEEFSLHYLICGEGPEQLFLEQLVEKLRLKDYVQLLGYRTDIPDLLGASDIFCMPARREGCGIAAQEAMAAGLPLITVRSHGTKVYAEHKEGAWCLKGDLVHACTKALEALSENKLLRRQMGAHNRVLAKQFSDADRMMTFRQLYLPYLET